MKPIIEITGLSYAYRGFEDKWVLRDINLEVFPNEFVSVAGRTGSGKSTLCYALNSLVPKSFGGVMEGSVTICGINTSDVQPAELAKEVGIVLQSPESQMVGLTVREDVEFGLENIALNRDEIREKADWALEVVKLTQLQDVSPWKLSGGQKQRLAIASALAFRPKVLVLDNPTAELDPIGKIDVLETINYLNQDFGITVFIVDQELSEILPYSQKLLIMDAGQIIAYDTPRAVLNQPELLRDAGIKLPDTVETCYQLKKDRLWQGSLPMTVDEALPKLSKQFKNIKITNDQSVNIGIDATDPLIEINNVNFNYPNAPVVLNDINLKIYAGDFIALMGQNGAGKTTLAKHLNGLLKPVSGQVLVDGLDTKTERVSKLATRVGYVFQNPDHQIFSKTVYEELSFGPNNLGWPPDQIEEAVQQSLRDIEMDDRADAEPYFMGLAERKLIAIASILIMKPQVLVLDEPATGADFNVALRIMRYISDLHQRGLTVLIITHDVSLAANYANRMIVMKEGKIEMDDTPQMVFQDKELLHKCQIALPEVVHLINALIPGHEHQIIRVDDLVSFLSGGN